MAALEVVKRRLDHIGLGNACLELHSHKTNKRETLNELRRTLNLSPQMTVTDGLGGSLLEQLSRTRSQLNEYADAVNFSVGKSGVAPYDAFGELLVLDYDKTANAIARRKIPDISKWSGADFQRKREIVEDLRLRLHNCGVPNLHPFWGSRLRLLLPDTRTELQVNIETTLCQLSRVTTACRDLADATQLACPETVSASYDLLTASQRVIGAPDTTRLNLKDSRWESTGRTILTWWRQEFSGSGCEGLAFTAQPTHCKIWPTAQERWPIPCAWTILCLFPRPPTCWPPRNVREEHRTPTN